MMTQAIRCVPRLASGLLLALAGCQATSTHDPGTHEPGTHEPGTREPGTRDPGAAPRAEAQLRAPFSVSRASFFHAALEIPPMESADVLDEGEFRFHVRSDFTQSIDDGMENGVPQHFSAMFNEWLVPDATWGLGDGLEVGGRIELTGWADHKDSFLLLDPAGNAIVTGEDEAVLGTGATERHLGFADLVLHARQRLSSDQDSETAALLSWKIPMSSKRDLSSAGTHDVNLGLLRTDVHGDVTTHVNGGVGVPLGDQTLFTDAADVDLDPWLYAGVGITWLLREDLAWGAQLEGNTSAFSDVDFLDRAPLTVFTGLRKAFEDWMLEGGVGTGLNEKSHDFVAHVAASRRF